MRPPEESKNQLKYKIKNVNLDLQSEIKKSQVEIKNNKACGKDIITEMLKDGGEMVIDTLYVFLN